MVKRKTNHFSPFLIISYISKSLSLNDTLNQVCLNWPSDFWDGSRFLKVANFFFHNLPTVYFHSEKDITYLFRMTQRCRMRSVKFHPKMFWAKFSWNWSIELSMYFHCLSPLGDFQCALMVGFKEQWKTLRCQGVKGVGVVW